MRIVLATSNTGKLRELGALLAPFGVEVLSKGVFTTEEVAETGLTFVENALLKARYAAQASGLPAIADDSGLEVDALHGAPGIYSARYAGSRATDADNLEKLVRELHAVPEPRTARYCCALVYLRWPEDPFPIICQASWSGCIARKPRGSGGFGYDPVFWLPDRAMMAAELSAEDKNRISHRGQALHALVAELGRIGELAR